MKKLSALIFALTLLVSCGKSPEDEYTSGGSVSAETTAAVTTSAAKTDTDKTENDKTESEKNEQKEAETQPSTEPETEPASELPPVPETIYYLAVPYYSQEDFPTGCELVSASMVLGYYGFDIAAGDLINEGYIEAAEFIHEKNDDGDEILIGGDPEEKFIGDPNSDEGYGCYSGAIVKGLSRYLENELYDVVDMSGMSLSDLCSFYIDYEIPVLVWATVDMKPSEVKENNTWQIEGTDQTFSWISNEHCMVLVGYNDDYYYFHDPLTDEATLYERSITEKRYRELGCQAVIVKPW